jgi:hypothetical protein
MKTLLHFGAHKTASTSIQLFLSLNRKKLSDLGIYPITSAEWMKSPAYESLKKIRVRPDLSEEDVRAFADFFKPRIEGKPYQITLFSNEGVYGQHNLAKMGSLYPYHERVNRIFAEGTADVDPVVVLYVRRQDGFLESTYLQTVHYGSYLPFYDYLSAIDLASLKWSTIVDSLHQQFGKDRVHVYPFEHIRKGFRPYLERAMWPVLGPNMTGVLETLNYEGLGSRNRSFSETALQIARVSYPFITDPAEQRAFRNFLQQRFSNETHERAKLITPQFRKFLMESYREDNKRLMDLCGESDPDMVRYYTEEF